MEATQLDGWEWAEEFFGGFAGDDDPRGRMSAINLSLLRGARPRWSNQLGCVPVIGICLGFRTPVKPLFGDWVRVEPRPDGRSGPTVAVTLLGSALLRPRTRQTLLMEPVVGATLCRVSTAPAVLESFLLQIGDERLADRTRAFWPSVSA